MSLNGSENLDPRFNHHYGSADENDPNNHPHHVPSFKEYTKSISKPPSTSFYSKPTSNISSRNGSIPSKNRVPVVTSFNKNDTKDAVQKLLINDARRHENGVLKQLNNFHSNTSNIRVPTSSIIPYHNVQIVDEQETKLIPPTASDSDYDEAPLLDLYKADELESKIDPGSTAILNSGITYEQITSATKTLTSQEYDPILQTLDDSRISFLNPHQAYVKVNYPQYTKPLAKNGTPLDLSQVPKNRLAPPFLDYEEPKLSQDETKLLQVLDHDLKLESYGDDNQFEFEDVNAVENIGGFVSFLQKLFKTGPFSKEAKYYKKFPWAKIFHNIDQESDLENQLTKYEKTNNGDSVLFERNNTDMFPINGVISSPLPLEDMTQTTEALRWSKKKARANK